MGSWVDQELAGCRFSEEPHGTTEFSFTREDAEAIGQTHKVAGGPKDKAGRKRPHTVFGTLMHSSLVATTDGPPQGLAAIKLRTREKFKRTNALQGKGIHGGRHSVNAEDSKPRTAERPADLIAMMCILDWRLPGLTMTDRTSPDLPA